MRDVACLLQRIARVGVNVLVDGNSGRCASAEARRPDSFSSWNQERAHVDHPSFGAKEAFGESPLFNPESAMVGVRTGDAHEAVQKRGEEWRSRRVAHMATAVGYEETTGSKLWIVSS